MVIHDGLPKFDILSLSDRLTTVFITIVCTSITDIGWWIGSTCWRICSVGNNDNKVVKLGYHAIINTDNMKTSGIRLEDSFFVLIALVPTPSFPLRDILILPEWRAQDSCSNAGNDPGFAHQIVLLFMNTALDARQNVVHMIWIRLSASLLTCRKND